MGEESFVVKKTALLKRVGLFQCNPSLLLPEEYEEKTRVPPLCFSSFVDIVRGAPIAVSVENCESFRLLGEEFGFEALLAKCTEFEANRDRPLTEAELFDLALENLGPGHRVTITTPRGSRTYETLTCATEITSFAFSLSDTNEKGIVIDGIEGKDRIVEKAVAVVCSNTAAHLQDSNTKDPFLAFMLWKLQNSLYFLCINSVRYCLRRLHQMAPTAFEKARLLILSQCDPDSPGEFKQFPKAHCDVINDAIIMLKNEKGARSAEARALPSVLKNMPEYSQLSGFANDNDEYSDA
jgi:hypothetical protein